MTTGRLAGVLTRGDGRLHGVLMWSVSLLFAIYLGSVGAGRVLGGVTSMLGQTGSSVAGGAVSGAGAVGASAAENGGVNVSESRQQQAQGAARDARQQIRQQAPQLQEKAGQAADQAANVASKGLWGALLVMGLSVAAATFGAGRTTPEYDPGEGRATRPGGGAPRPRPDEPGEIDGKCLQEIGMPYNFTNICCRKTFFPCPFGARSSSPHPGAVMRKLSLNLDDLQVESFATAVPRVSRGTVMGHVEENNWKYVPQFSDGCKATWDACHEFSGAPCESNDCETIMCETWNDWACDSGTCA